ncbi:ATP-binding protein, partial [Rhizobium ruizarguesonis]
MTFRVAARTVLELGAELISSDAIAIYELVKNAFDARSPSVLVSVQVVLKRSSLDKLLDGLDDGVFKDCATAFKETKKALETEEDDDNAQAFLSRLDDVSDLRTFRAELQYAYSRYNYIRIVDTGLGMSLPKLREAFLTIGTANRVLERKRGGAADKPILGEKGVGRLAAMRLGSRLYVKTSRPGDTHWSQLSIDWDDFSRDPSQLIDDVPVKARKGFRKAVISDHGTTLTIRNLSADWTLKSLREMAAADFSRLVDPFAVDAFPIAIAFNQTTVETRKIGSLLFKNAHGYCKGQYKVRAPGAGASPVAGADPNDRARLLVDFDYRLYSEKQHFDLGFSELRDAIGQEVPEGTLSSLGAFSFEFYWYNRRILTAIDGIGKQADVRKLVNAWS